MTDKTNETSFPNFLQVKASSKQIRAGKVNYFSTDHESKTACKLVLRRRPQSQGRGKLTRSASQGRVGEDFGNEVAQLQARPLVNKKTHPIISPPRIKHPSKSIEMNSIYHDVLMLNYY